MAKTEATTAEAPPEARPNKRKSFNGTPRVIPFFQRVSAIPKEDWGTRATIKVYRLDPVIDRLRTSDNKYICVYAEPVDEERIKVDHGSGRYRLYLNYKMPAEAEGKELDSIEFDIMDQNYPPKIPPGEWVDDPKNKKWAWAKSAMLAAIPPVASPPTAGSNLVETMLALDKIQDSAVERSRASQAAPFDPLAMMKGFLDLMPKPAPSSENGMFTAMVAMMTAQMQQQGQIMQAQQAASQAEAKELREELREMRNGKQGGVSTFKEIIGEVKSLLPDIKEFFPVAESRPRNMPWWAGTLERVAEGIAPVIPMVVQQMMAQSRQPQQQPNPGHQMLPPGRANAPGAPPQTQQPSPLIDMDAMLLSALESDRDGADLADAVCTMYGDTGRRFYRGLIGMGEEGILNLIKGRPIWNDLGPLQEKVPAFVKQFVDYSKEDNEPESAATEAQVEVI